MKHDGLPRDGLPRARLTLLPRSTRLQESLAAFLLDRQAMRCTPKTIAFYEYTLGTFTAWLAERGLAEVGQIRPARVRAYLVGLQKRGLKDTTQHGHARAIRAWCRWLVAEGDLKEWPMRRVAMPKLEQRVPAPFSPEDVKALMAACDRGTPTGSRDYAIVLSLLDSGLGAAEFVALKISDLDMRSGLTTILGKGRKQRQVRVGAKARAAIRRMLSFRANTGPGEPLWAALEAGQWEVGPLSQSGLGSLLRRLGKRAGVEPCAPHRFRRTFALMMLRAGCDLHSLRVMMGHSSLAILQRYLALAGEDVERAHSSYSPVDRMS